MLKGGHHVAATDSNRLGLAARGQLGVPPEHVIHALMVASTFDGEPTMQNRQILG